MPKRKLLAEVRAKFRADLAEYTREAEHQDGAGYWRQFKTADLLYADIILYIKAKEATTNA